jgi:hypothetical protein
MPESAEGRFRSHLNYIESFSYLGGLGPTTRVSSAIADLHAGIASPLVDARPSSIDVDGVHRSLRNAWSTELLLALPGQWATDDDEFMRLSNTWGVVQTYYVGYHATQALIIAKGNTRPDNHPKTQRQYAALWVDRPLTIPPWTFGCAASGWMNLPAGEVIDDGINSWTGATSATAWSLAAKALMTTRRTAVKEAVDRKRDQKQRDRRNEWRAEEQARLDTGRRARVEPRFGRPQLSASEKSAADRGVRTFTLLDYLYRLRIGANYDDAAVFFDGPTQSFESSTVHRSLVFLAAGSMLLAELRIAALVGRPALQQWGSDFTATCIPAGHRSIGLAVRQSLW